MSKLGQWVPHNLTGNQLRVNIYSSLKTRHDINFWKELSPVMKNGSFIAVFMIRDNGDVPRKRLCLNKNQNYTMRR